MSELGVTPENALLLPPITRSSADAPAVLWRLMVAVALFGTAVSLTITPRPALILAAAGSTRDAAFYTGILDAMTASIEIVGNPVLGLCSDVVGRRPVLLLSQFGELGALLIIAQFSTSIWPFFIAYAHFDQSPRTYYSACALLLSSSLAGSAVIGLTGVFFATVSSVIADVSVELDDPSAAAANYGLLGATFGACFLVGPVTGGVLEDRLYTTASFHVASFLILLSICWVYFFVPETRIPDIGTVADDQDLWQTLQRGVKQPFAKIGEVFRGRALKLLACAIAISSLAQGGLNSVFFLYLNARLGWGTSDVGLFLSGVGASLLVSQGILVRLAVPWFGEKGTIVVGYSCSVLHYVVYGFARSGRIAYAGLLVGMVSFIADPAMKGLLCRQVRADKQGTLQGALAGLTTLLRPLAPLFATATFTYGTWIGVPGLVFFVVSFISAIALVVATIGLRTSGLK